MNPGPHPLVQELTELQRKIQVLVSECELYRAQTTALLSSEKALKEQAQALMIERNLAHQKIRELQGENAKLSLDRLTRSQSSA